MINSADVNTLITECSALGLTIPTEVTAAQAHLERVWEFLHSVPDVSGPLAVLVNPASTDKDLTKAVAEYRTALAGAGVNTEPVRRATESRVQVAFNGARANLADQALKLSEPTLATLQDLLATMSLAEIRGETVTHDRLDVETAVAGLSTVWGLIYGLEVAPRFTDVNGHVQAVDVGVAGLALFTDIGPGFDAFSAAPRFDISVAGLAAVAQSKGGIEFKANTLDEAVATVAAWSEDQGNWERRGNSLVRISR